MEIEKTLTEKYAVVATKSLLEAGADVGEIIHRNFEVLQREFPKLGLEMAGPVILISRFRAAGEGLGAVLFEIETAYPVAGLDKAKPEAGSPLFARELEAKPCWQFVYTGPVWETPWDEVIAAARKAGAERVFETREVYRLFKGGGSPENEIDMQVIEE